MVTTIISCFLPIGSIIGVSSPSYRIATFAFFLHSSSSFVSYFYLAYSSVEHEAGLLARGTAAIAVACTRSS